MMTVCARSFATHSPSGKPWTRQLNLCNGWLEIITEEIKLRGHELSPTEVNALSIDAARIRDRADALIKSLQRRG
jgi:hypothetical protein